MTLSLLQQPSHALHQCKGLRWELRASAVPLLDLSGTCGYPKGHFKEATAKMPPSYRGLGSDLTLRIPPPSRGDRDTLPQKALHGVPAHLTALQC